MILQKLHVQNIQTKLKIKTTTTTMSTYIYLLARVFPNSILMKNISNFIVFSHSVFFFFFRFCWLWLGLAAGSCHSASVSLTTRMFIHWRRKPNQTHFLFYAKKKSTRHKFIALVFYCFSYFFVPIKRGTCKHTIYITNINRGWIDQETVLYEDVLGLWPF